MLTTPSVPAYKEKMKELSVLSLICSCFYPEPRNISIYTYDGEFPAERLPPHGGACPLSLPAPCLIESTSGGAWSSRAGPSYQVLLLVYGSKQFEFGVNNRTVCGNWRTSLCLII